MRHSVVMSISALLAVLVIAAVGWALAGAWHHDDACSIEEWQCTLGSAGFAQVFISLFTGAIAAAWVLVELVSRAFRSAGSREDGSWTSDARVGAFIGLVLQAAACIIALALE